MSSLVIELQTDAINPSVSILNLLRKALVVAKKLEIKDFEDWIELELNGYTDSQSIPQYRYVPAQLRGWNPFHGWQPVIAGDDETLEFHNKLCNSPIGQPISQLVALTQNADNHSTLCMYLSPEIESFLVASLGGRTPVKLRIGSASIKGIIEAVQDIILRWALKLEKDGIIGEGMTFSEQEKAIASSYSYYNIFIENLGNKSMSSIQNNDFRGASIGGGVAGRDYTGDVIHNHAAQQNLAEAAAEIQQLLKQLEQSYPTETLTQKAVVAEEAITRIENNPSLKERVIGALKSAGKEAFKEAVDHPLVNVLMAGIEGWQEGK